MNTTKGQIKQVFIYLVAIFIIGAIALIGAKSLFGIMDQKEQVDYLTFKENIVDEVEDNNIYGTVNERRFSAPGTMNKLCFINSAFFNGDQAFRNSFEADTGVSAIDFVIEDSVKDNVENNIFVSDGQTVVAIGYSDKVLTNDDVVCINTTNGYFNLKFKGRGRQTLVAAN
ncbi:MAG: hypothetical protein ACLFTH_00075 [Candidatus Woesearchaeota archaeon]